MKKIIALSLVVLSISACGKKEDPEVGRYQPGQTSTQTIPETKVISYHSSNSQTIGRYVDEEYGNVCYVYDKGISCLRNLK